MEPQQYYLSPELAHRLAAIDIGTNSIRMIVAEGLKHGNYRILDDEKEATRLGRNLATTGRLNPEAVEASLQTLRRMKQIIAGYQVRELRSIATCAVREAADGEEFCRRVHDEVGLDIEIVSAEEEARLAFCGVLRSFDLENKNVAVVDIGGGSTEIILASNKLIESIHTTPLGAVRISELYGGDQAMGGEEFTKLLRNVARQLRKHTEKPLFVPHMLIGSGGTFTTLAAMTLAAKGQSNVPPQGAVVTQAELRHLLERLRKMSPKSRRGVAGLSADRADIIVAGLAIVDAVLRRYRVNQIHVHSGGVRDGLLLTMVDETWDGSAPPMRDRVEATLQFASRCGVDLMHCRHVARLAGSIFAQLAEAFSLDTDDRTLLETAAYLMDVGYLIDYDQHHKHSYHLISNSRLPGFQPRELALIANIARYHRGARPKKKHENFRKLSRRDQQRVRRLAAILRLAGGLDRSHSQQVSDVRVDLEPHEVVMRIVANENPEVDLWGARRRSVFFEKAFDVRLAIDWHSAGGPNPPAPGQDAASGNGRRHRRPRSARPASR
jgi:exopolyphosphatase/guanosine-5'-triphosphate,3'-diphosphate pyrophosphatase